MMMYYVEPVNGYLASHYSSLMGRMNTFGFFTELGVLRLNKPDGYTAFIVPNTILTQEYYQPLRAQMLRNRIEIINVHLYAVFRGAVVETTTFVAKKALPADEDSTEIVRSTGFGEASSRFLVPQNTFLRTHKNAFITTLPAKSLAMVSAIQGRCSRLGAEFNINQAIALKHNRAACLASSREDETCVPIIDGRNIGRYYLEWGGDYFRYDLSKIHSCKRTDIFECDEKVLFRRVGERLTATLDAQRYYALNTLVVITPKEAATVPLRFVLGLFNSRFLNWYYANVLKSTKKVFSEMQARQVAELPLPYTASGIEVSADARGKMVTLVDRMLTLHERKADEKNPETLRHLETEIAATDRQIDRLVYELYDLSEDEIKLVEQHAV